MMRAKTALSSSCSGMNAFCPIDSTMIFTGCQLSSLTRFGIWLNRLIALMVISISIYLGIEYPINAYDLDRFQLRLLASEVGFLSNIIFIVHIYRNRMVLQGQINKMSQSLQSCQWNRLRRFSYIITLLVFSQMIRVAIGYSFLELYWHKGVYFVIYCFLDIMTATGNFFKGTAVYLFIVKLITLWEESYFDRVKFRLKKKLHESNPREFLIKLCKERRSMNQDKEELIDCLRFLPVIWFLHLFLMTSGVIVFAQREEKKDILLDVLTDGLTIASECIVLIILMVYVDQCNDLVKKSSQSICDVFTQDTRYFSVDSGVLEFHKRCNDFEFSVWSMFTLNKRLLVGFVGSLLTFTTLFIQIAGGI